MHCLSSARFSYRTGFSKGKGTGSELGKQDSDPREEGKIQSHVGKGQEEQK